MTKFLFCSLVFSEYLLATQKGSSTMAATFYTLPVALLIGTVVVMRLFRRKEIDTEKEKSIEPVDTEILQRLQKDVAQIEIEKQPFRLSGMLHVLTNKISNDIEHNKHLLYYDVDREVGRYIIADNDYLEQTLEIICQHLAHLNQESEIILHLTKKGKISLLFEVYNKNAAMPKKKVQKWNSLETFSSSLGLDTNLFVKAKKIAAAMGGSLVLESSRGWGVRYQLEIPYYPDKHQRSNQELLKEKLQNKSVLFIGKSKYEIERVEYIFQSFGLNIDHLDSETFKQRRPNIAKYDMVILRSFDLKPQQISYFKQVREKNNDLKVIIIHELFESEQKIALCKPIADAEIYNPAIIGDIEEVLYQMYILKSRAVKGINNVEVFDASIFKIEGSSTITKEDMKKFEGAYIIVAEDSKVDQRIIRHILSNKGMRIFYVQTGQEVLDLLEKEPIDLIFSDINMPVMDGLLMTKKIRQHPEWKDIPIISISSMSFEHEVRQMQVAGMNAAITKPIVAEDVYMAMKRFLNISVERHQRHAQKLKDRHDTYQYNVGVLDVKRAMNCFEDESAYIEALKEFVPMVEGSADAFAKIVYEERRRAMSEFVKAALPAYEKIHATEMVKMFEEILLYLSYENNFYMIEYAMLYQKNLKILLREIEKYLTYMEAP